MGEAGEKAVIGYIGPAFSVERHVARTSADTKPPRL
jgi:hypothetical protein